jgi:hypothetical protein
MSCEEREHGGIGLTDAKTRRKQLNMKNRHGRRRRERLESEEEREGGDEK